MNEIDFKIQNGSEDIAMLSAHNVDYDNVSYWQVAKLINVIEQGIDDIRMFISRVYSDTDYFRLSTLDSDPDVVIDIEAETVTNFFGTSIYSNIKELSEDYPVEDVAYREENGKAYAKWKYDNEYEIKKVYFDQEELFTKKVLTFDEVKKLDTFIGYLLDMGDLEYILPSGSIIRLTLA